MFGTKRKLRAFEDDAIRLGMSLVDDPTPWLGVDLDVLLPERSTTISGEALEPGDPRLEEFHTVRTTKVYASAVNTSLSGPGLLAAVCLRYTLRERVGSHRTTVEPFSHVLIGRLPRAVETPVLLAAEVLPDLTGVLGSIQPQIVALTPDHELLHRYYLMLNGDRDRTVFNRDISLAAAAWSVRPKLHGEPISNPELQEQLETLLPPVDRLTDFEILEFRGDLIALVRQAPRAGLNDTHVSLVDNVALNFPG